MIPSLRLALAALIFLCTLPGLFNMERLWWWKATLAVSEYGHRLALLPLLLLLMFRGNPGMKRQIADLLCVVSLTVLLLPLSSALLKARSLPAELTAKYGPTDADMPPPLSFADLFLGQSPSGHAGQWLTIPRHESPLRLIFYRANSATPAPCIVALHSGGWEGGDPDEFPEWSHHWAGQGYATASIDYRIAPLWQWPAPRDDVKATLAYLKTHAKELGIKADCFILLGRSAGAQIASACAYGLQDPAVRGCVSLYGPADMDFAWKYARRDDILDSPRLMRNYLGGAPDEAPKNYHSASATLFADAGPPALIIHGQRDTLVWHLQSSRLAARLKEKDIPHHLLEFPWATHALDYPFHGPSAQLSRYALHRFLRKVTQ